MTWTTFFLLPQLQDLANYCIWLHLQSWTLKKNQPMGRDGIEPRLSALESHDSTTRPRILKVELSPNFSIIFSRLKRRLLDLPGLHPSFQLRVPRLHRLLQDLLPGGGHRPLLRLGSLASHLEPHRANLCAKKRCTNGRRWEQKRLHCYGTSYWTSYTD